MGKPFKNKLEVRNEQNMHATVERMCNQVADLFQVNAVSVLQVSNYFNMTERAKRDLCDTFMPITLCKVPARDGNGVLFFLNKEAAL